jgi:inosine triphosphate pyrophosphatase
LLFVVETIDTINHNMAKLSPSCCNLSLLLLFVGLNVAAGFTSDRGSGITNYARRRQQLFASADKGDANGGSSGGAGSWRTKAKEFLDSNNGEDVEKKLNIAFVTGNAMKQREINTILSKYGATSIKDGESFVNLRILDVDLPEIQEINTEAVAKNKAIQGAQLAGGACVVEDTSLEFHALGGMPGPFIKWFQDKLGSDGLYKILIGYEDKAATAVCTLAFCPYPHADPVVFTGRCTGKIVEPIKGRGFGWDSIFVPDGETEPFSCMPTEKKCELSHVSLQCC